VAVLAGGGFGALSGCLGSPSAGVEGRELTDLAGRTVTVPAEPERIVPLEPNSSRLVAQLDATELIAGVESEETGWLREVPYNLATPELADRPVIGGRGGDPEAILAVEPDLLLSTGSASELEDTTERTGLPTFGLTVADPGEFVVGDGPTVETVWERAGAVLGRTDRAAELVDFFEELRSDLADRTAGVDGPTTYASGMGFRGGHGFEGTRPVFAPFDLLGAANVAADVGFEGAAHVTVSPERLLEWDPEVVFLDRANLELVRDDLADTPAYRELTAFEAGTVHALLPNAQYGQNHANALVNAYYVGSVLYPDAFGDVDVERRAAGIYETVLGRPLYEAVAGIDGGLGPLEPESLARAGA